MNKTLINNITSGW